MVHDRPADEVIEQLSLYALGALDPSEAAEVAEHLRSGCSFCGPELAELRNATAVLATASAIPPPSGLREKVMALASPQVWKGWDNELPGDLHAVRSGEGEWQTVRPGVHAKQLYVDRTRDLVTMLVRMEPGSSYVPHRHRAPEQCFVLEGDIRDGSDVFYSGDFQCKQTGSVHGAQTTENGCLLLIVSSLGDELL
jgi:anti-sigma factor ChrR (cupin superfamily)